MTSPTIVPFDSMGLWDKDGPKASRAVWGTEKWSQLKAHQLPLANHARTI